MEHDPTTSIDDARPTPTAHGLVRMGRADVPTRWGTFTCTAYRTPGGDEHLALHQGPIDDGEAVLVRLHSECMTGDVLGSRRCDCGPQLDAAMQLIADEGRGVLVYMRGHEGRGIGLAHKIRAYALQDAGRDTVDANLELGLGADLRDYSEAAGILIDLGVGPVLLVTNNPAKYNGLDEHGITLAGRVPTPVHVTPENEHYLRTKRDRMGHLLDL